MATYAIYRRDDDTVFVRDGYSWRAFMTTLVVSSFFASTLPHIVVGVVVSFLFGALGKDLKCWWLTQRGYTEVDLVAAGSLEEAELKYFSAPVSPTSKITSHDTLGLFTSP
jgi:hypothetical protein